MAERTIVLTDFYVYVLFRENGIPFYIGKGRRNRWIMHEWEASHGRKGHRFNIIRKMQAKGFSIPKVKLHEGLLEDVANAYEIALIAAIGRMPVGPLVNLTAGGEGASGIPMKPHVRAMLSARQKGKSPSPEIRSRISASLKGRPLASSTRAAMSETRKNPSQEARQKRSLAMKGRVFSQDHRAKITASKTGAKASIETRKILSDAGKRRVAKEKYSVTGQSMLDI
jgi:hypothetical protein